MATELRMLLIPISMVMVYPMNTKRLIIPTHMILIPPIIRLMT